MYIRVTQKGILGILAEKAVLRSIYGQTHKWEHHKGLLISKFLLLHQLFS